MRPGADRDPDDGVMGVGVTLLRERLQVAVAVLVDVVDDPRLFHLPVRAFPGSLADRHGGNLLFSKYCESFPKSANAWARHICNTEEGLSIISTLKCLSEVRIIVASSANFGIEGH